MSYSTRANLAQISFSLALAAPASCQQVKTSLSEPETQEKLLHLCSFARGMCKKCTFLITKGNQKEELEGGMAILIPMEGITGRLLHFLQQPLAANNFSRPIYEVELPRIPR